MLSLGAKGRKWHIFRTSLAGVLSLFLVNLPVYSSPTEFYPPVHFFVIDYVGQLVPNVSFVMNGEGEVTYSMETQVPIELRVTSASTSSHVDESLARSILVGQFSKGEVAGTIDLARLGLLETKSGSVKITFVLLPQNRV